MSSPANVYVDQALSVSLSPSFATYDAREAIAITALPSGGTPPYTYQWYNATSGSNVLMPGKTANVLSLTAGAVAQTAEYMASVTDSATTNEIMNSIVESYVINTAPTLSTPIPSKGILDSGQQVAYNVVLNGGTGPFTVNLINTGTGYVVNTITWPTTTPVANIVTFGANVPTGGSSIVFNVVATDTGATPTPFVFNSVSNAIRVNPAPTLTSLTPSNMVLDSGQYVAYNVILNGGTGPFTLNLINNGYVVNTITWPTTTPVANVIIFGSNIPAVGNLNTFNVIATDTATPSAPFVFNSVSNAITVNSALAPELTASITPALGSGETEVFMATVEGGVAPFTYNYLVVNTVSGTLLANALWSNPSTTNTFGWTVPSNDIGNTIQANVIIKDSATTPDTANSVKTAAIMISGAKLATISILSNATVDVGQYEVFTGGVGNDGSSPYTYNFFIVNSVAVGTVAHSASYGNSLTSNTFALQITSADITNSPEEANVIITDNGAAVLASSYSPTFVVHNALIASPPPSASNSAVDIGQSTTLMVSAPTTGSPPYAYQWYSGASATCTGDSQVSGQTELTYTSSPTSNRYYCIQETDSATTKEIVYTGTTQVIVSALPTITLSPQSDTIDAGQSVSFTNTTSFGTAPFSYSYSVNAVAGFTQSGNLFTFTAAGTYNVLETVTDATWSVAASSNSVIMVSTAPAATTTSPQQAGNGGTNPGGAPGGGGAFTESLPYTNGTSNQTGYRILNFTQDSTQRFKIGETQFNVTLNFLGPDHVGINVNGNSYTLYTNQTIELDDPPEYAYYAKIINISYLPVLHSVDLEIYGVPLSSGNTITPGSSTTTMPVSVTSTFTTTIQQKPASNATGPSKTPLPIDTTLPSVGSDGLYAIIAVIIIVVAVAIIYRFTRLKTKK